MLKISLRLSTAFPQCVYIFRDPRDVCLSHHHFSKVFMGFTGTLDDYINAFIGDCGKNSTE